MSKSKRFSTAVTAIAVVAIMATAMHSRWMLAKQVAGRLSNDTLSKIYGLGEGNGCLEELSNACSKDKEKQGCVTITEFGVQFLPTTGKEYSDQVTWTCTKPPNSMRPSTEEIPCWRISPYTFSWGGDFGLICNSYGDFYFCESSNPSVACAYTKPSGSDPWVPADSCVCIDP
jgi:hypothetical protein